ncbi:uncharacterized protein LOC135401394 [Ornithodoros turicata]|uniref:uncharacterized protein LOC135401394 n=1 Tax=Ornithodoros turicata TaxID=34597 RepID=UPI0031389618
MSSRPFRGGGRRGRSFFPRGGGFRGRFNSRGGGRNKRFDERSERTYYKDKYKSRSRSRSRSRSISSRSRSRSHSRSRSRSSSRSRSRSQHRDSRSRKYPSKKELHQLAQSVNDAIAAKERDDRRDPIGGVGGGGQKRPGTSQRGERQFYNASPPRGGDSPSDPPYHYGKSRFDDDNKSPYRREFEALSNEPHHGGQSKAGGDFRSQLLEMAMKEKQKLGLDKLDSPRDTSTALKAIQGYSGEGGQSPDSDRPESPPPNLYDDVPKPLFPISEKRGGARSKPDPGGGKWGDKFTSSFMPVDERKKAQEPIFPGVDDYDPRMEQKDSPRRGHQTHMTIPGLGLDENIDDEEAFLYGESEEKTPSRPRETVEMRQDKRDYGMDDRVSSGSLESWSSQSRYTRAQSPELRGQQKGGSRTLLHRAEKAESSHMQGRPDRPEREDSWNLGRPEHRSQNRLDALDPRNVDRMDRPEPRAQSRFDSFEPQSQCRQDKSPDRSDLTIDLNLKFDRRRPGQQEPLLREDDKLFRDSRPSHLQRKQSLDDGDDLPGPRRPSRRRSRTPDLSPPRHLSPPRRPVAQFSSDPSIEEMKQELMQLKMMLNKEKAGIPDEHSERKRLRSPSGSDSYLRGDRSPSPGKRRRGGYSPEHRRYNSPPSHYRNRSPTDYRRPSPPSRRSDRSPYYRSPPRRYSPSPVNSLSPVSDRSHGRRRSWSKSPPPRSRRSVSPRSWSRDSRLQQTSDVPAQQTFYNEVNVSQPYYEAGNPPVPMAGHIPDLSVPPPTYGAPGMQPPNPYYGYQAPVPPNFLFPPPAIAPVQLQQPQQQQQQQAQQQAQQKQAGPRSNLRVVPLQRTSAQVSQLNAPMATQGQTVKMEKQSPVREVKEERKVLIPSPEAKPCINSEELDNYLRLVELKDSQRDRLNLLKQEMVRLGKIQNEIMRRKQHERDGHKDPFLLESSSLYEDVKKQVLELNNVMEETSRKIYRIPQKVKMDALKRKQEREAADDSGDSSGIRFIYEDPRDHWCQSCNTIVANVNEIFKHLHSDKHKETIPTHERPWAEIEKPQPPSKSYQRTIVTNLKGVQFMVGMSGYYCKLCKVMSGDSAMARNHLFSTEHNQNYTKFILLNPFYERRWKMERDVALAHSVKEKIKDKPSVPTSPSTSMEQPRTSNTKSNKDEKQERIRKKSEELLRAERESAKSVKELDDEAPPSRSTGSKDKSKEKAGIKLKLLKGQKTQKPAKPSPVVIIGKAPCFRPSFLSGKKATAPSVAKKEAPVTYGPALPPDMMQAVAREEMPQDVKNTVVGPVPVGPAPVGHVPVGHVPVGPVPVGPAPLGPAPVGPAPVGPAPKQPDLLDVPLPVCAAGPRKPKQLKSGVVEKKVERFRPMTEEDLDLQLLGIERDDVEPIAPVKPPPAVVAKESENVSQVPMDLEDSGDTEKAVECSAAQSVSKDCTVPMEIEDAGALKAPKPIHIGGTNPPPSGGVTQSTLPQGNVTLSGNSGAGVNVSPATNATVTLKTAHVPVSTAESSLDPGAKVTEQNVKQVSSVATVQLQDTLSANAATIVGVLKTEPVGKQTTDKSESGAETIRDASGDVVTPIVGFERGKPVVVKRTVTPDVSSQQGSKDGGAEVPSASAGLSAIEFPPASSTNMEEQVQVADSGKNITGATEIIPCTPVEGCVTKKMEQVDETQNIHVKVVVDSAKESSLLVGSASNGAQENSLAVERGNVATQSAGDSGTAPQQPDVPAPLTLDIKQDSPVLSAPCVPEHVHKEECDAGSVETAAPTAGQPEETPHLQEMPTQSVPDIKTTNSVPPITYLPAAAPTAGQPVETPQLQEMSTQSVPDIQNTNSVPPVTCLPAAAPTAGQPVETPQLQEMSTQSVPDIQNTNSVPPVTCLPAAAPTAGQPVETPHIQEMSTQSVPDIKNTNSVPPVTCLPAAAPAAGQPVETPHLQEMSTQSVPDIKNTNSVPPITCLPAAAPTAGQPVETPHIQEMSTQSVPDIKNTNSVPPITCLPAAAPTAGQPVETPHLQEMSTQSVPDIKNTNSVPPVTRLPAAAPTAGQPVETPHIQEMSTQSVPDIKNTNSVPPITCLPAAAPTAGQPVETPHLQEMSTQSVPDIKNTNSVPPVTCLPAAAPAAGKPVETPHIQEMSTQSVLDIKSTNSVPPITCLPAAAPTAGQPVETPQLQEMSTQSVPDIQNTNSVPPVTCLPAAAPTAGQPVETPQLQEMSTQSVPDIQNTNSVPPVTCLPAAAPTAGQPVETPHIQEMSTQSVPDIKNTNSVPPVTCLPAAAPAAGKPVETPHIQEMSTQSVLDIKNTNSVPPITCLPAAAPTAGQPVETPHLQEMSTQSVPDIKNTSSASPTTCLPEHVVHKDECAGGGITTAARTAGQLGETPDLQEMSTESAPDIKNTSSVPPATCLPEVSKHGAEECSDSVSVPTPSVDNSECIVAQGETPTPMISDMKDSIPANTCEVEGTSRMEAVSSMGHSEYSIKETCDELMPEAKDDATVQPALLLENSASTAEDGNATKKLEGVPSTPNPEHTIKEQGICVPIVSDMKDSGVVNHAEGENAGKIEAVSIGVSEHNVSEQEMCDTLMQDTKDACTVQSTPLLEHGVGTVEGGSGADKMEAIPSTGGPEGTVQEQGAGAPLTSELGDSSVVPSVPPLSDSTAMDEGSGTCSMDVVPPTDNSEQVAKQEVSATSTSKLNENSEVLSLPPSSGDKMGNQESSDSAMECAATTDNSQCFSQQQSTTPLVSDPQDGSGALSSRSLPEQVINVDDKDSKRSNEVEMKSVDQQGGTAHGEAPVAGTDASKSDQAALETVAVAKVSTSPRSLDPEAGNQVAAGEPRSMDVRNEPQDEKVPKSVSGSDDKAQDATDIMSVDDCVRALDSLNSMATGASMEESSYFAMHGKESSDLSRVETAVKSEDQAGGEETCMDTSQNECLMPDDLSAADQPANLLYRGSKVEENPEEGLQLESSGSLDLNEDNSVKQASQLSGVTCEGDAAEDTSESKMQDLDFAVVDECSEDNGEACMEVLDEVTNDEDGIVIVMDQA